MHYAGTTEARLRNYTIWTKDCILLFEAKSEQPASEHVTAIPARIKNNAGWWA